MQLRKQHRKQTRYTLPCMKCGQHDHCAAQCDYLRLAFGKEERKRQDAALALKFVR
jgi:hypothetical protein